MLSKNLMAASMCFVALAATIFQAKAQVVTTYAIPGPLFGEMFPTNIDAGTNSFCNNALGSSNFFRISTTGSTTSDAVISFNQLNSAHYDGTTLHMISFTGAARMVFDDTSPSHPISNSGVLTFDAPSAQNTPEYFRLRFLNYKQTLSSTGDVLTLTFNIQFVVPLACLLPIKAVYLPQVRTHSP